MKERLHDMNAYVRSNTLKTWILLCEHQSIPLNYWSRLTKAVLERIKDKSVLVRKYSIQVQFTVISHRF